MNDANKNLGQCHACQGTVSKKAKTCPHCGEKKPFRGRKELSRGLSGFLIISAVLIGISMIAGGPLPSDSANDALAYPENTSREKCQAAIRRSVSNPSTLSMNGVFDYATNVDASGIRRITQSFSAKNAFGLEKTYDAYCTLTPQGDLDIQVEEQG